MNTFDFSSWQKNNKINIEENFRKKYLLEVFKESLLCWRYSEKLQPLWQTTESVHSEQSSKISRILRLTFHGNCFPTVPENRAPRGKWESFDGYWIATARANEIWNAKIEKAGNISSAYGFGRKNASGLSADCGSEKLLLVWTLAVG